MKDLPYTAKDRATINAAWSTIQQRLETTTTGEQRLADILRLARSDNRPTPEAKAHVVNAFKRGWLDGATMALADVADLAAWYILATTLGASQAKRRPMDIALHDALTAAIDAHEAALQRFLADVRTNIAAAQA